MKIQIELFIHIISDKIKMLNTTKSRFDDETTLKFVFLYLLFNL